MDQRSDGVTDCEDKSDEKDCRLTVPNVGSNKFLVPPPAKGKLYILTINSFIVFR